MKHSIKMMLAAAVMLPALLSPNASVAEGIPSEGGMMRYDLWVLPPDCTMIESTTREVNGVDGAKAFIHVTSEGGVYFKFEGVPMDRVSTTINISGKRSLLAKVTKTDWGFFVTPSTHIGNRFVIDELTNNGRIGITFNSGVGAVWPVHGAKEAIDAMNVCVNKPRPAAL